MPVGHCVMKLQTALYVFALIIHTSIVENIAGFFGGKGMRLLAKGILMI